MNYREKNLITNRAIFRKLLEQWKLVLITAIIIMLLFMEFQHVRLSRAAQASAQAINKLKSMSGDDILSELPEGERKAVDSVLHLEGTMARLQDYIDQSAVMQLDPYHVKKIHMVWVVRTDEENADMLGTLLQAYETELTGEDFCAAVLRASEQELVPSQIREMVAINTSVVAEFPLQGSLLTCDLMLPDDVSSEKMQSEIESVIPALQERIASGIGPHTIELVAGESRLVSDAGLVTKQTTAYTTLNSLNSSLNNLKNSFTGKQSEVYKKAHQAASSTEEASPAGVPFINKRNAVIGFVLGVIGYLILYLLYVIFSKRVQDADALETGTGIRSFGEWYQPTGGIGSVLTKDTVFFRQHHKDQLDEDKALAEISENIISTCRHRGITKVLVAVGAELDSEKEAFVRKVTGAIADTEIKTDSAVVLQKRGKGIGEKELSANEGVVLVVEGGKTRLADMDLIVEKSGYYEIPVLGSVYLG